MARYDKHKAGTTEIYYTHTDECENWAASIDEKYHDPTTECIPVANARLPHQCDSWHIGTVEDVERMIADLRATVKRMRGRDDAKS